MGADIIYKPINEKDQARCHRFGVKMLPGLFLGYEQQAGGGWSGDLWIVDQEEIAKAEHSYEVYPKRLKAAEVEPVLQDGQFTFPLADGSLAQPGPAVTRRARIRNRGKRKRLPLGNQVP